MTPQEIEAIAAAARGQMLTWALEALNAPNEQLLTGQCDKACGFLHERLEHAGGAPSVKRGYVQCDRPNIAGDLFGTVATTRPKHWWIVIDDYVVDVTAEQFNYAIDNPAEHFPAVLVVPCLEASRHIAEKDVDPWERPAGWSNAFRDSDAARYRPPD